MKKKLLTIATLTLVGSTVLLNSCKKEDVIIEKVVSKVSGFAYANTNETNDTLANGAFTIQNEFAPAGTKVTAAVDPSSYTNNPDNTVNYENVIYNTVVGSDGSFSFDSIASFANNMNVQITFSDFAFATNVFGVDATGAAIATTEKNSYSANVVNVTVVKGIDKISDVTYAKN